MTESTYFVFDPHPLTKAILDYTVGMLGPHPWTSVTTSEGTICLGLMYFYYRTSMTKTINGLKAKYHIFIESEDLLYVTERLRKMFVFLTAFSTWFFHNVKKPVVTWPIDFEEARSQ